jgi:hypothetical protein
VVKDGYHVKFDTVLVFVVLVVSFLGAARAFENILARERPATPIESLPAGTFVYDLLYQQQCIARLNYELSYDGSYSLLIDSELVVLLAGKEQEMNLDLQVYFNSLGQFTAALLMVRGPQGRLVVQSEGVNPFAVTVKVIRSGNEEVFRWSRNFPGPVELIDLGDGEHFRVQYRSQEMRAELEQGLSRLVNQFAAQFSLDQREVSAGAQLGEPSCKTPIALDSLIPVLMRNRPSVHFGEIEAP